MSKAPVVHPAFTAMSNMVLPGIGISVDPRSRENAFSISVGDEQKLSILISSPMSREWEAQRSSELNALSFSLAYGALLMAWGNTPDLVEVSHACAFVRFDPETSLGGTEYSGPVIGWRCATCSAKGRLSTPRFPRACESCGVGRDTDPRPWGPQPEYGDFPGQIWVRGNISSAGILAPESGTSILALIPKGRVMRAAFLDQKREAEGERFVLWDGTDIHIADHLSVLDVAAFRPFCLVVDPPEK